ncbi:MAG TPA: flagellar protein FliT [Accumulibacter sp.]|uniref:Flagellar protein FliT n=2 Tax=Candidatus Accumulibacter TaxID=327159 RepID=A0A080M8C0_9PROT|nr:MULTISPECIES: flagellar protein FliT [Candidatus Accumulibacter]KFB77473.1 MAG: Flagellar protein FliT [Candidatus Accumulibacter cognatus]MBL8402788.1 flagellar protein FliT [Accumulibacter sp.]MBN8517965.1 flagellar protein FliT [Accumulibacter sp.]MBO3709721.1 flagellar protein FliT [Accumulibacter sp.]MCC2868406.1 flagellar protein FliT [Candidatus Accumulibacter phosphatis]
MSSSLSALEHLLALAEAMLSAAENSDWDLLARYEADRRALTDSLPNNLTSQLAPAAAVRARTLIENCQRCDARIRPLVEARLNELRVVLREV